LASTSLIQHVAVGYPYLLGIGGILGDAACYFSISWGTLLVIFLLIHFVDERILGGAISWTPGVRGTPYLILEVSQGSCLHSS